MQQIPTDLSREGVVEITTALRQLLADSFALYLKTKNFHWHMTGRHFRDYHLLLDEQGEQIFAMTDEPYASTRSYGSERGAISDGRPYRDSNRLLPACRQIRKLASCLQSLKDVPHIRLRYNDTATRRFDRTREAES